MILSHKHKYIFLKTNKTAGTSVELALSRHCGPQDIITRVSAADEQLRRETGGNGPQNHLASWRQYGARDIGRFVVRGRRKMKYFNHTPAWLVKQNVDPEIWRTYYKFCYERNPWDRVVSLYYWHHQQDPRPSMDVFLDGHVPKSLHQRGWGVYTIDDEVVVDRICRFENLQGDLDEVAAHLGIEGDLSLPRAKGGFRKDKRMYREILTPAQRDRIAEMFSHEIELLGYEF